MPKPLFFALKEEKRAAVLQAALAEFAAFGYGGSSTNRIVRAAGISKGSLFQYFDSKEELYFYLLDSVAAELTDTLGRQAAALSPDLFQRVLEYSALEFSWHIQHPEKGRLLIDAFAPRGTALCQKTLARYGDAGTAFYYLLLEGVDPAPFRWEKEKTFSLLKWLLQGFNADFLDAHPAASAPLEQLQTAYRESLSAYLEMLRAGLLR